MTPFVGSTSSTGTVGRWYRYDPWGSLVASGGSGFTPIHRFQGSFGDLTAGLVWMVTRWYDPTTGRFLSEDSLLGEPVNPDSRHRYAYGAGDPVNTWDPDGRASAATASRGFAGWRGAFGTFVLSIFIQQPYIQSCLLQFFCASGSGDGHGFTRAPACAKSRACLTLQFGRRNRLSVTVNPSHGKMGLGPKSNDRPHDAFPIVWHMPGPGQANNGISFKRYPGYVYVSWNLKNSVAPATYFAPAIDGSLRMVPPKNGKGRWSFVLQNDKFPSLQLFQRKGLGWTTIARMAEHKDPAWLTDGPDATVHGYSR